MLACFGCEVASGLGSGHRHGVPKRISGDLIAPLSSLEARRIQARGVLL